MEHLGGHRSDLRILGGRCLSPAGEHHVSTFAVIVFGGIDAPQETQTKALIGCLWQEFNDGNSRDNRCNPAKWSTGLGCRFMDSHPGINQSNSEL